MEWHRVMQNLFDTRCLFSIAIQPHFYVKACFKCFEIFKNSMTEIIAQEDIIHDVKGNLTCLSPQPDDGCMLHDCSFNILPNGFLVVDANSIIPLAYTKLIKTTY